MGFSLITELPFWFSILCLIVGAFYAWLMYRKSSILKDVPVWQARVMAFARFLLVSLLCFLLLGPMIRTIIREVEKPIVVLALDESQSIINSRDSSKLKEYYKTAFESLKDGLKNEYEVRSYAFGDHVRENPDYYFNDKETDFSSFYDAMDVQFANRNVGAIVIASDGLYNEGDNPVYGPTRLKVPVYTIALGDTTIRKDLVISKINNNRIAFLGNSFPLEVILDARQCAGSKATLTIEEDSVQIFSRAVDLSGNNFHASIPVLVDAKKKGIRHYVIRITSLPGEVTYSNNVKDVFIEVVENKQKVLILANAPHPDLGALKNIIETSQNYEVKIDQVNTFDGRLGDYSLVILHNIPSVAQGMNSILEKIKASNISTWFILGPSTNITAFNALETGLSISQSNDKLNETLPVLAPEFSLFTISDGLKHEIGNWPPLKTPFGIYSTNSNIYPLLYQKIGSVATKQPLLFFSENAGRKTAVLAGEGIWKWRLADFNANNKNDLSTELVSKVVQYLSVKENRSPFRVLAKTNFRENEALIFDAELYNQSDQLVNDPEAKLTISNNSGKQFLYTFTRTEKAYTLNAGMFPVGNYHFKAEVKLGDKLYAQQGEFSVSSLQLESSNTVADHQLLNTLATRSGAAMFAPSAINDLLKTLKQRDDLKSVSYSHKKLKDLINIPWIFVLLISLLSLEWFLRKRAGSY